MRWACGSRRASSCSIPAAPWPSLIRQDELDQEPRALDREQRFEHDGDRIALAEYQMAAQAAEQRVHRLTTALTEAAEGWRFEPVVAALRALRGIDTVCAIGLVTEIGDISRFGTARQLMAYLGLVRRSTPAATAFAAARSPRPATPMPGGC